MVVDAKFDRACVNEQFDDNLLRSFCARGMLNGVVAAFHKGQFAGPNIFFCQAAIFEIRAQLDRATPHRAKRAIQVQAKSWSDRARALFSNRHGTEHLYATGTPSASLSSAAPKLLGTTYEGVLHHCENIILFANAADQVRLGAAREDRHVFAAVSLAAERS
jgi:hypothetical protein